MRNRQQNSRENNEDALHTLEELLRQLQIQQQEVINELREVRAELTQEGRRNHNVAVAVHARGTQGAVQHVAQQAARRVRTNERFRNVNRQELRYTNEFTPRVNDQVRIRNPHAHQRSYGIVAGFCRDGKVKVDTGAGNIVIRKIENIICTHRYTE